MPKNRARKGGRPKKILGVKGWSPKESFKFCRDGICGNEVGNGIENVTQFAPLQTSSLLLQLF